MDLRKRWVSILLITILLLGGGSFGGGVQAQDGTVTLTLAVPIYLQSIYLSVLDQFEAANPGIKVQLVSDADVYLPPAVEQLDYHLQSAQQYASKADIVYVSSTTLSVESTLAGYFLNLAPLTSADPTLNPDDFFPAFWQAFQWNQGVWALPAAGDVIILAYEPAAFDQAGLSYPNGQWTLDDLANAARVLTVRDAGGNLERPGLMTQGQIGLLFRSLLGEGLYDGSVVPNQPRMSTNPALISLITTWFDLQAEGIVDPQTVNLDSSVIPMQIGPSLNLLLTSDPQADKRRGALLPGGKAGLNVDGFAVSAGTLYPQQAYELVKFLTNNADVSNGFIGVTAARRSLVSTQSTGDAFIVSRNFAPEVQALIDEAVANALPPSELRYFDYMQMAFVGDVQVEGAPVDIQQSLQQAEATVLTNQQAAVAMGSSSMVNVATPVPEVALAPGKIAINFSLTTFVSPLPNQAQWDQVVQEFVASDPEVGNVILDTTPFFSYGPEFTRHFDCFYLPFNALSSMDPASIMNLDPFMDADTSFDRNDIAPSVLSQIQRDNKTWAYPVAIQPMILMYDGNLFTQAGLSLPEGTWTVDMFELALRSLKPTPEDPAVFSSLGFGGTYIEMLVAAYGGVPLDYRTDPPTVNFTDPVTAEAIRQVLDLAKDGYIRYEKLVDFSPVMALGGGAEPITTVSLGGFFQAPQEPYRMVTFPRGTQYTGASLDISTAFISASAQNPQACYRWLSTIARHPELFSAMPARTSLLYDSAVTATQPPNVVAVYQQFDTILRDPNTIVIPAQFSGSASMTSFIFSLWLNMVFDRYVLEDADLESELTLAESKTLDFQACMSAIPPLDPSAPNAEADQAYMEQLSVCAIQIDPELQALFGSE